MNTRYRMAKFPRLRELRERHLGWEVADLMGKLDGRPSVSSIYRLEQGGAIRLPNVRRVFDAINRALDNSLDADKEIKLD
jgi:hypothetical protein